MDINEAAAELGVRLLPWQEEVGQAILDGERAVIRGGKRAGRKTLAAVVAHAKRKNATKEIER